MIEEGEQRAKELNVMFIETSAKTGCNVKQVIPAVSPQFRAFSGVTSLRPSAFFPPSFQGDGVASVDELILSLVNIVQCGKQTLNPESISTCFPKHKTEVFLLYTVHYNII